jgi:hypothetical protein
MPATSASGQTMAASPARRVKVVGMAIPFFFLASAKARATNLGEPKVCSVRVSASWASSPSRR